MVCCRSGYRIVGVITTALVLGSCGGGGSKSNANQSIDTTFTAVIADNQTSETPIVAQQGELDEGIEMVFVEGGTLMMGCTPEQAGDCDEYNEEKAAHSVTVDDFYISKHLITQKQWVRVMGYNPSHFKGDDLPVENVTIGDVAVFIGTLNEKITGREYLFVSEARWEYAARGGNKSRGYKYAGSNDIDDVAWYAGNSGGKTHPVGTKRPNELGLYDMSGNVDEWVGPESREPRSDEFKRVVGRSLYPVIRGGNWGADADRCRVSARVIDDQIGNENTLGFRLARDP